MVSSAIKVFADLTNSQLVASNKGSSTKPFTDAFHQDKLYLSLQPLAIDPDGIQVSNPYQVLDGSAYAVTVLIVDSTGATLAGPTVFSALDGTARLGSVDLNTAAMVTAFTLAGTLSIDATAYLQFDDGANQKVTIKSPFTIYRSYITAGTPSQLPLASYMTRDEQMAMFVKYANNPDGASIELTNGAYKLIVQCNSDGSNASDS